MKQKLRPIPNAFTMEPLVHITIEHLDGTKESRMIPFSEFKEWQESGGDADWFENEDDEEE